MQFRVRDSNLAYATGAVRDFRERAAHMAENAVTEIVQGDARSFNAGPQPFAQVLRVAAETTMKMTLPAAVVYFDRSAGIKGFVARRPPVGFRARGHLPTI